MNRHMDSGEKRERTNKLLFLSLLHTICFSLKVESQICLRNYRYCNIWMYMIKLYCCKILKKKN